MRVGNARCRLINNFMPRVAVSSHLMIGVRCAQDKEDANNARMMSLAQSTHALDDASCCWQTTMSHGRWKHVIADMDKTCKPGWMSPSRYTHPAKGKEGRPRLTSADYFMEAKGDADRQYSSLADHYV
uniref:Uncharacterized protein n=1 Tax=Solanum lycopersicum TaxID=4081 RepID=K4BZ15_SOLLC